MYLEAAKHSVEPALTVTEQDTYLYQSGWYRRVIGPFFGSDDPAFFVSVDRMSSLFSEKEKERENGRQENGISDHFHGRRFRPVVYRCSEESRAV